LEIICVEFSSVELRERERERELKGCSLARFIGHSKNQKEKKRNEKERGKEKSMD
jgi:hypothetical protein